MKRINIYIAASAVIATAALLESCAMEAPFGEGGEGWRLVTAPLDVHDFLNCVVGEALDVTWGFHTF